MLLYKQVGKGINFRRGNMKLVSKGEVPLLKSVWKCFVFKGISAPDINTLIRYRRDGDMNERIHHRPRRLSDTL